MKLKFIKNYALILILVSLVSCSEDEESITNDEVSTSEPIETTETTEIPAIYFKIYGATNITSDGTYVTINTNGMPDHKSVYYPISDELYEDFSGTTFDGYPFVKNPNVIESFDYSFKIPLNPTEATNHVATPLGAIGVSLNGVPLFNQYAGPDQPLTDEFQSFDKYWGHPTGNGTFHYHIEPLYLTTVTATKSSLLGFLLDGFPVYGPEENGTDVTGLDAYHGHNHATEDYPDGTYHYHITNTDPYINGNGYYGTPGTVTQ
ncbi:YHYH protein [Olleya sp. HaHaR_3_96]|uniref:YHYH protein n=1 Tax=Olleya sp. HaHaR_3_96 TaxID=2745560 RepID=UPI001C4FB8B2|nr:YHYH protein [Olleya sp. HaHaR_3_96]QXP59695.1 YHYH protein [Olleya sp. HaHaR_3_96]